MKFLSEIIINRGASWCAQKWKKKIAVDYVSDAMVFLFYFSICVGDQFQFQFTIIGAVNTKIIEIIINQASAFKHYYIFFVLDVSDFSFFIYSKSIILIFCSLVRYKCKKEVERFSKNKTIPLYAALINNSVAKKINDFDWLANNYAKRKSWIKRLISIANKWLFKIGDHQSQFNRHQASLCARPTIHSIQQWRRRWLWWWRWANAAFYFCRTHRVSVFSKASLAQSLFIDIASGISQI